MFIIWPFQYTVMRQSTDLCLLCKTNSANKTNSHILPKFLSKKFLMEEGKAKKGYAITLGSDKTKTIQDSPKEDYILCDECESYFSILESQSSPTLLNWKEMSPNVDFTFRAIDNNLAVIDFLTAHSKSIFLLVYSIFWRVGISEKTNYFDLDSELAKKIRDVLLNYKSVTQSDYNQKLNDFPEFEIIPFIVITANDFQKQTANILFGLNIVTSLCLYVDQFIFILYNGEPEDHEKLLYQLGANTDFDKYKMLIASEFLWENVLMKKAYEGLAHMDKEIREKNNDKTD